nr:hypothetical protein [Nonomuraea sp. ATCC 55076]
MPQHRLHHLQIDARGQRQSGGTMAQVVQPDRRLSGGRDQAAEPAGEVVRAVPARRPWW